MRWFFWRILDYRGLDLEKIGILTETPPLVRVGHSKVLYKIGCKDFLCNLSANLNKFEMDGSQMFCMLINLLSWILLSVNQVSKDSNSGIEKNDRRGPYPYLSCKSVTILANYLQVLEQIGKCDDVKAFIMIQFLILATLYFRNLKL